MLKWIGILSVIIAAALAGYTESHKLSLRVNFLEKFLRFLSSVKTEIRYSSAPVDQIIAKHGEELSFLGGCEHRLKAAEGNFSDIWNQELTTGTKGQGLKPEDMKAIQGFGREFGSTDLEGQLSHCELYTQLLSVKLNEAREEKERKAKLYIMLGVSAGLAAVLLLC